MRLRQAGPRQLATLKGWVMCDCSVDDGPSCYRSERRKARNEHRCVECGKPIRVGDIYEYASGIWDGCPGSFKTCLRCVVLRDAHIKAEELMQLDERSEERRVGKECRSGWWRETDSKEH